MSSTTSVRALRVLGASLAAVLATGALASCAGDPDAGAVDFEGVQSATVQIEADGTFIEPGTLNPVEYGSRGSGFIISSDGLVVTNNHVVTGAGTLKIWVGGDQSQSYGATVLGASECLDLAVVQIQTEDKLPFFAWHKGESKPGLEVYSAGFPLGDPNFTLTKGIVSKADIPLDSQWASLDHVIEHDARIRGGNSGGPLVDAEGRVVGVNYAGDDELDYNFAIHRDQVQPVIADLAAGKLVQSLGVNAQALAPAEDGSALGIWVSSVKAGGAADKAGIEPGDVMVNLAGVSLAQSGTLEEYCEVIRTQGNDAAMDVTVYRPSEDAVYEGQINGSPLTLSAGSTTPQAPTVGSFVTLTDDTQSLTIDVPDTWRDVNTAQQTNSSGLTFASIIASPDIAAFQTTWSTPGVQVIASKDAVGQDVASVLAGFAAGECTLDNSGPYDDSYYVGQFNYYTGCGGGTTDFVVLAVKDVATTHLLVLTAQLVSESDKTTTLDQLLNTFYAQP